MDTLSNAEAIHISTVLEDCIDQLIILGRIMPVPSERKPDAEQACPLYFPVLLFSRVFAFLPVNQKREDDLLRFTNSNLGLGLQFLVYL